MGKQNYLVQFFDAIFHKSLVPTDEDNGKILRAVGKGRDAVYFNGQIYRVPRNFQGSPEEYGEVIRKDLSSKL